MFSRSSAMIRRFSRKAHKWLRTVTFIFLIGTYEMFSRGSSMIRRFSRKTHKWLRTVFFYLSHGSSFLRVFLVHLAFRLSSRNFHSSSAPWSSYELFLLKNSDFLAAAYLQNVFSQFLQVSFICYCCAVVDGRIDLLTFFWDVLKTLVYSFCSTSTPFVLLLGLKVYEVRNVFTPNPS